MNGGEGNALGQFFMDMAEDHALYNDYLANPLETMRGRGIAEDLISAVLEGDLHHLHAHFRELQKDASTVVILGTIVRG